MKENTMWETQIKQISEMVSINSPLLYEAAGHKVCYERLTKKQAFAFTGEHVMVIAANPPHVWNLPDGTKHMPEELQVSNKILSREVITLWMPQYHC